MGVVHTSLVLLIHKFLQLKNGYTMKIPREGKSALIRNGLDNHMIFREEVVFMMLINIALFRTERLINWMDKFVLELCFPHLWRFLSMLVDRDAVLNRELFNHPEEMRRIMCQRSYNLNVKVP
jgi:hypothetical protein